MSFIAIGIGMLRDSATVMVGQYFKKKRCLVEMLLLGSSGLGVSLSSPILLTIIRYGAYKTTDILNSQILFLNDDNWVTLLSLNHYEI